MTTTTSASGKMITTRGRFSTGSSVIVLCLVMLVTKSCGIVALNSGDGEVFTTGIADAWSENENDISTTFADNELHLPETETGSGSGILETTELPHEDLVTTTEEDSEGIHMVPTTNEAAQGEPEVETTSEAAQGEPEVETTSEGNEGEPETTNEPEVEQTTATSGDSENTAVIPSSTTIIPEDLPSSSTEGVPAASAAPSEPELNKFHCPKEGNYAHISGNCRRFHSCDNLNLAQPLEQFCPPLTAYSPVYGRCTRDLSACIDDGFNCTSVGRFPGHDDTYYFNCVPTLRGGLHKYQVRCSIGERFEVSLGGCWRYDWSYVIPGEEALEASDLAAIKSELKQLKGEEKLRLKALKLQEKLARKQQKEKEKQAKKAAKELAKQQQQQQQAVKPSSGESIESVEESKQQQQQQQQQQQGQQQTVECSNEGVVPSQNSSEFFYCFPLGGQWKLIRLSCPTGYTFDATLSACTLTSA